MRFEINGNPYQVAFEHNILSWLEYDDTVRHDIKGFTTAILYSGTNGNRVDLDIAFAICSASDNFCKETGRKVALRRMLDRVGWDRDARRAVWQAYWRERGVKRG